MRARKTNPNNTSLRLALIFFLVVSILFVGSGLVKLYHLIEKSTFDGDHRYTLVIQDKTDIKHATVISFAPDNKTIVLLFTVTEKELSAGKTARALGVFTDGSILTPPYISFTNGSDAASNIRAMLFNYTSLKTNLTIIDIARLWLFAKTVPPYNVTTRSLDLETSEYISVDELVIDRISSQLFTDDTFLDEKMSIQIVNGTNTQGLGNRLARVITNSGGNVVSVTTSDKTIDASYISYYKRKTYTLRKLEKILGFSSIQRQEQGISDIVITLGKDQEKEVIF